MSMPKPRRFWVSRSKCLGYPLGLQTISPTESSPNESSNLPRPASAIPVSYVKAQSRNYASICSETNRGPSGAPNLVRSAGWKLPFVIQCPHATIIVNNHSDQTNQQQSHLPRLDQVGAHRPSLIFSANAGAAAACSKQLFSS